MQKFVNFAHCAIDTFSYKEYINQAFARMSWATSSVGRATPF